MEAVFAVFVMAALLGVLGFYGYANWRWYQNHYSDPVSFLGVYVSPAVKAFFWVNVALVSVCLFCAAVSNFGSLLLTQSAGLAVAVYIGLNARRIMAETYP